LAIIFAIQSKEAFFMMMPRIFFVVCSIWMAVQVAMTSANPHHTGIRHLQSPASENSQFGLRQGGSTPTRAPTQAPTPVEEAGSKCIFDTVTQVIGYFISNIGQVLHALDNAVVDLGNNTTNTTHHHVDGGS
jgi:hypothetical protein